MRLGVPPPPVMNALKLAWVSLAVAAAVWFVSANWSAIAAQPLDGRAMASAFALSLAAKIFAVLQMRASLAHAGHPAGWKASLFAYSAADLAKYLPGGVWAVAGRVVMYRDLGMRGGAIVKALTLEQLWLASGAGSVGAVLFSLGRWPGAASVAGAALILAAWAAALALSRRRFSAAAGGRGTDLGLLVGQAALWGLAGGGFAALGAGGDALTSAGAFCLAFSAGLLVPFAPGGIGVREAVGLALLAPLMSAPEAARLLLLSRGLWIAADLSFAALALPLCRASWKREVARAERIAA